MKILGIAIVVIAVLASCGDNGKKTGKSGSAELNIAFYIKDSIAENFAYYKTNSEELKKEEDGINARLSELQVEGTKLASLYESKMQQGVLAPTGRTFYENKIKGIQDEMRSIQESEGAVLNEKAVTFENGLLEKLDSYSKAYAEENNLNLILAKEKMGTILYGDESMDITMDLIKYMNDQENK